MPRIAEELIVNLNSQRLMMGLSALRPWLTAIAVFWLLSFIGLGWLVQSLLVLLLLLFVTPIILFFGARWWLKRNIVQEPCPACGYTVIGLNNRPTQCPQCNETIQVEKRQFQRSTPPGTVDVQAVEVEVQVLDD